MNEYFQQSVDLILCVDKEQKHKKIQQKFCYPYNPKFYFRILFCYKDVFDLKFLFGK